MLFVEHKLNLYFNPGSQQVQGKNTRIQIKTYKNQTASLIKTALQWNTFVSTKSTVCSKYLPITMLINSTTTYHTPTV